MAARFVISTRTPVVAPPRCHSVMAQANSLVGTWRGEPFEVPFRGVVDGREITNWTAHRRTEAGLGAVFQTTRPLEHLDVLGPGEVGGVQDPAVAVSALAVEAVLRGVGLLGGEPGPDLDQVPDPRGRLGVVRVGIGTVVLPRGARVVQQRFHAPALLGQWIVDEV